MSTPILLQRILLAMEGASRRQALMFALLSLIVRLISTQSSILNLWFGRRCYERSRGEMITMIYEKTLDRKIIVAPQEGVPKGTKRFNWFRKPDKEPASMGKILNLMRSVMSTLLFDY